METKTFKNDDVIIYDVINFLTIYSYSALILTVKYYFKIKTRDLFYRTTPYLLKSENRT